MEIRFNNIEPYFVFLKHSHYMNINIFQVVYENLVLDSNGQGIHKASEML